MSAALIEIDSDDDVLDDYLATPRPPSPPIAGTPQAACAPIEHADLERGPPRATRAVMTDASSTLDGLHRKLGRELLQSERDCRLHTRREAHRQGPGAPSEALLAIAHHADACEPRLVELLATSPLELGVARAVAHAFSNLRYGFFDRVLAHERTYRATLLGVRHALDLAKLLFSVADRREMTGMRRFLSETVPRRAALLVDAVAALERFADHPLQAAGHS